MKLSWRVTVVTRDAAVIREAARDVTAEARAVVQDRRCPANGSGPPWSPPEGRDGSHDRWMAFVAGERPHSTQRPHPLEASAAPGASAVPFMATHLPYAFTFTGPA